jgi:peptidoglycan/LPS O-acetylase OafA/YrhL
MTEQRRIRLLRTIFWATAGFAFVMAVIPHPPQLPGAPSDKVQHIAAFLVLGALASFAYPRTSPVYLATALSLFGAVIELVQLIPSLNRDGDPIDWIADTAAAGLILIFLHRLHGRRRSAEAQQDRSALVRDEDLRQSSADR